MKIYYLNDEQKPVNVFMDGLGEGHFVARLEAAQGKLFDYKLAKNHVVWIKKWPDYIMISSIEKKLLEDEKSPSNI